MELYKLLETYAQEKKLPPDPNSDTPELGKDLSQLHTCLIETGLRNEQVLGLFQIIDPPQALTPLKLSRLIISYTSNNSGSPEPKSNSILFDLYSFLKWLEEKNIPHGLETLNFQEAVKSISSQRNRCQQVGDLIDSLSENALEEPPTIYNTWHDEFAIMRILSGSIIIQGKKSSETLKVPLPKDLIKWIRMHDRMELTLGNTSSKWIIIERNAIFPGYPF